jgi:hypothetical protein
MTAEEARKIEGQFGVIEGRGEKHDYPMILYGTVTKVESRYLLFETTGDELALFNLRKVIAFTPKVRRHRLKKLPLGPRVKPKNIRP